MNEICIFSLFRSCRNCKLYSLEASSSVSFVSYMREVSVVQFTESFRNFFLSEIMMKPRALRASAVLLHITFSPPRPRLLLPPCPVCQCAKTRPFVFTQIPMRHTTASCCCCLTARGNCPLAPFGL